MFTKDVPITMGYPPNHPDTLKFAMGHPFYGLMPGLFLYETIWMREHNRYHETGMMRDFFRQGNLLF